MKLTKVLAGLAYYTAETVMNEPRLSYYFVIACKDVIYFYTQAGITPMYLMINITLLYCLLIISRTG